MKDFGLSRDVPVKPGASAILVVDVQNYSAEGGGRYAGLAPDESAEPASSGTDALARPRWAPAGVDFHALPAEAQEAVVEILEPAYHQLVRDAADPLEKSTGLTVVHLMWLEILDQLDLGEGYIRDPFIRSLGNRENLIARHLQIIEAKVKASAVLVRLREFRKEWGDPEARQITHQPCLPSGISEPPARDENWQNR